MLVSLLISPADDPNARTGLAFLLFVGSLALFWRAVAAFRTERPRIAFSPGVPDDLVTRGPYRLIRHPFYVAYTLSWIGGALGAPNWATIAAVPVMGYLYVRAARAEETEIAHSPMGQEYANYKRRTGMFFPRLIRR